MSLLRRRWTATRRRAIADEKATSISPKSARAQGGPSLPGVPLSRCRTRGKAGGAKGLTCTSTFTYISGCESTVRPEPSSTWEVVSAMLQPHRAPPREGAAEEGAVVPTPPRDLRRRKKESPTAAASFPLSTSSGSKRFRFPPPAGQARPEVGWGGADAYKIGSSDFFF